MIEHPPTPTAASEPPLGWRGRLHPALWTIIISVMAVAPRGAMYAPSAVFYMEKLVTGPEAAELVDIRFPVAENISIGAKAKGGQPSDMTGCVLDRPRHAQIVDEIRATGARIKFITDGDVAGAIMAARPGTGVDMLIGVADG